MTIPRIHAVAQFITSWPGLRARAMTIYYGNLFEAFPNVEKLLQQTIKTPFFLIYEILESMDLGDNTFIEKIP